MDTATAAAMVIPEGKSKALLQFNRLTGAPTMHMQWVDPATMGNPDLFIYVEDYMDFTTDVVVGNYPDYQIVDESTLPEKIYEATLDLAAQEKITKAYPVVQQVNVVSNAIVALESEVLKLAEAVKEQLGVDLNFQSVTTDLVAMRDYINEVKTANQVRKEFYASSPDYEYITNEQLEALQAAQLEGGVHELYGAREITGGSVF